MANHEEACKNGYADGIKITEENLACINIF